MLKYLSNHAGVVFVTLLALVPYKLLVSIGHGLGYMAARIPGDRNRVVKINLQMCFPKLDETEIDVLSKKHWRLLGRSLVEKSIIWRGSENQLSNMIEVKSAVDLTNRKPRILVNMHFTGIEGSIILKRHARGTGAAGFKVFGDGFAVDGFGKNTCTGRFAYSSRTTKKKCLGKVLVFDCILKGGRDVLLPHDTLKICRSIFSCRNNEIFHPRKI